MSKEMRQSQIGTELLRLGFTTQEVNSGMASYLNIVRGTGKMQNYSTAQLAEQSGAYMKNLQTLAKITGQTVEEKKKEAEALAKDVQFRAAMQKLAPEEQAQMMNMINSYPEAHRTAIKDMLATGSITTEEGRKFQALYPEAAANFRNANKNIRQGQGIGIKAQEQMRNAYITESKSTLERNKQLLTYSREFDQVGAGIIEAQSMEKDAYAKAAAEQDKIAKEGGATAEQIAKFKQNVAQVSNEMTKGLISETALKAMETAFMGLATFTQKFVVPALRFMFDAISYVVDIVGSVLSPIFTTLGFVADMIAEGFKVLKPVIDIVMGAFSMIGKVLGTVLVPVIVGVGAVLAVAFAPMIAKIALVVGAIGLLSKAFSWIGDTVYSVADGFMDAIDAVRSYLPTWLGGISKDEAAERKRRRESERQEREARRKSAEEIDREADARKASAKDKSVDFSSPTALLKSFGEATGSVYAKRAADEEKRLADESNFNKTMDTLSKEKRSQVEQELKSGKLTSEEAKKLSALYPKQVAAMRQSQDDMSRNQSDAETSRLQRQATGTPTTKEAEKPGFFSRVWDTMFGDSKKSTDEIRKAEKAAADEKIEYTVNGKKVTKEEYEAQIKGMNAWGKSLGLNLDSATQQLENTKETKDAGMSAGTKGGLAGAGIGMLFGGPVGAAIGGFIGNRIAKVLEKKPEGEGEQAAAESLPEALNSTTQALILMRDRGFKPFTADLVKFRQEMSGDNIAAGFEDASSTIKSLFNNPFIARGSAAGAGGGGGAARAGGGGGAGGGTGGGGDVAAKLPSVSDKQGKPSPGDEALVGDLAEFVKTPSGANLDGLDDGTKKRLAGLAKEYFNETGEKIQINTAFRSYEDQLELFHKYGSPRAARPGRSKHEVGLAFDMQSAHANKAIQMGLFSKYGFHRPIASESWHIEPVEARGGVPDNPVSPGQEVMVANSGRPVTPDTGKPQAAKGGILSGPKSGYDATLHGTEAVVPLPDGKNIPVNMDSESQKAMVDLLTALNTKMEQLIYINSMLADIGNNQLKVQKNIGHPDLLMG